jgi:3-oxoacyl-[acyl-carrier-protein] synthase II
MRSPEAARAVVTGLGVVSSIGCGAEPFWRGVLAGRSGAKPIRSFDTSALRTHVGCEVDDEALGSALDGERAELPRTSRLALAAAAEALTAAGLHGEDVDALCVGTTMGDLPAVEDQLRSGHEHREAARRSSLTADLGTRVARSLRTCGPAVTIATSCSAGNIAICRAVDLVRSGRAERVLAGGADSMSRLAFVGFSRLRAMAPERCTPFAAHRKGMILGEGAAFLLVESGASARARGVRVQANLTGYGLSCDAHSLAHPAPDGRGAALAMAAALRDAALAPEAVDYVSAHGTGTQQNDLAEASACKAVFGSHRPYVSSIKALVGHCLGGASAIEAAASVLSIRDGRFIPAWNVDVQDPACDVELPLPGRADSRRHLNVVLSNGFAFGGNNSCLVLERPR